MKQFIQSRTFSAIALFVGVATAAASLALSAITARYSRICHQQMFCDGTNQFYIFGFWAVGNFALLLVSSPFAALGIVFANRRRRTGAIIVTLLVIAVAGAVVGYFFSMASGCFRTCAPFPQ